MKTLGRLFANNRQWAASMIRSDPAFFERLSRQQTPDLLWIGCSDSRVPANVIVGLLPGELFVHRNVANLVVPSDLNGLAVIQYGVEVLKIRHIIVCGHYGCGGVREAVEGCACDRVATWLWPIRETEARHARELAELTDPGKRLDRLCELNVVAQVNNVGHTPVAQDAWRRGASLTVHGWIYGIENGLLQDLGISVSSPGELRALEEARSQGSVGKPALP